MIDTQALQDRLASYRWFGGKGRDIAGVRLVDEATLDGGAPRLVFAIVSVLFSDGLADLYHLPLLVHEDGSSTDAFEDAGRLSVLGDLMAHARTIESSSGAFQFGGPGLDPLTPPGKSVRRVDAEQSNSSLVLDDEIILKLFRRVEAGANPDLELNRLLTNEGFDNVPSQVGEISYAGVIDGNEIHLDLGIAQQFLPDGGDGWKETVDHLHRLYESVEARPPGYEPEALLEEHSGEMLSRLEELGGVTAAMHVALSRQELDPQLSAEPIRPFDLRIWADGALDRMSGLVELGIPELEELSAPVKAALDDLMQIQDPGLKARVHGDYHLGQTMLSRRGWMLLDFEGEPLRSLEERRAKQSPLKDVAGMLRSFSYACLAPLLERIESDPDRLRHLEPLAQAWESLARERFLSAYLRTSHEGRFLPKDRDSMTIMLDAFEIDKALYELSYERAHRPDWIHIPLRGIARTVRRREG